MIPETRSEIFLANIAGEQNELPAPQSRIEHYLNAIAQAGDIHGGSAGAVIYDKDASYPDGSVGAAMQEMDGDISENTSDISQLKSQINEVEAGFPQKSAQGAIVTIEDGADNVPVVSLEAEINPVQSGSGDPAPDNVRPISGWTGANVFDTGVNVWDEEWEHGKFNLTTGAEVADDTRVRSKNYLPVKAGETYHIVTPNTLFLMLYDGAKNYMYEADSTANYTIPAGVAYLRFSCPSAYGATYNHDISINYPATDTSYHAYNGSVTTITFPDSAGTVYGGTLTLNQDGTADLVVDHATVDLGTLDWQYDDNVEHERFQAVLSAVKPSGGTVASLWCSDYKVVTAGEIYQHAYDFAIAIHGTLPQVWVYDTRYTDKTTFKTAMNGVQAVYELATPVTYHIEDVDLVKTLYGLNNIWASSGDIELTYRCDPATFTSEQIQTMLNAMVAPVEATTTASKAYVVNEFLIMDNVLYKVIANIASGGTITINTNVSATTIGEQITAILNS